MPFKQTDQNVLQLRVRLARRCEMCVMLFHLQVSLGTQRQLKTEMTGSFAGHAHVVCHNEYIALLGQYDQLEATEENFNEL